MNLDLTYEELREEASAIRGLLASITEKVREGDPEMEFPSLLDLLARIEGYGRLPDGPPVIWRCQAGEGRPVVWSCVGDDGPPVVWRCRPAEMEPAQSVLGSQIAATLGLLDELDPLLQDKTGPVTAEDMAAIQGLTAAHVPPAMPRALWRC